MLACYQLSAHLPIAMMSTYEENTTVPRRITVRLVSSLTRLDSTASLNLGSNTFSSLVKSNLVKLETSCTVILPLNASVFWPYFAKNLID